jgi:hypothetical protein
MGCDVERSKCSHCGHVATNPHEYCKHIVSKGAEHEFTSSAGERLMKRSYENCYGIGFFEISAVFDPADESALLQELIDEKPSKTAAGEYPALRQMKCPYCSGLGCANCGNQGTVAVGPGNDGAYMLHGDQGAVGNELAFRDQGDPPAAEGPNIRVDDEVPGAMMAPHLTMTPEELRHRFQLGPIRQGSYLAHKIAEAPEPQFMHTKAPQDVDTLREEKVCPTCGEVMDGVKCKSCGYEEPPEGFGNPDLTQAKDAPSLDPGAMQGVNPAERTDEAPSMEQNNLLEGAPAPGQATAVSYLQSRKSPPVTSKVAGKINTVERPLSTSSKPATNEPKETVISDQDKPVTAAFRTAMDLITAAQNTGEKMADNTHRVADGATPADPVAKADKQVDATGIGGVMDASNESASKADTRVAPDGKGATGPESTNESATSPDSSESLPTADENSDDSGFNHDKNTDDSGPTKTFPKGDQAPPVTDKAYPTAAKKGGDPVDPIGKAQKRVDVEEQVEYAKNGGDKTRQWTGTDGNGVTRQAATTRTASAQEGLSGRVPSFKRVASEAPTPAPVDPSTDDSSLFLR